MRDTAVARLVGSDEPAVRFLARRDLLGEAAPGDDPCAGRLVTGLFAGQRPDGGFGGHPYRKWTGAHWRLVSLVELGVPVGEPRALAAVETVLAWLTGRGRLRSFKPQSDGLVRRCASQEGNALAVCSRLGLADDPRVRDLATALVGWQWPDGGWNCDPAASGRRSSFAETLPPMWGLHEYATATGDASAAGAASAAAELLLAHRVLWSLGGGTRAARARPAGVPIAPSVVVVHYPPYWHYDVLQALVVLGRMGRLTDPRAADAVALLRDRRGDDGLWHAGARWWKRPGANSSVEAVDWGAQESELCTLNALRVLKAARSG